MTWVAARMLIRLQDRLLHLLGNTPEARAPLVTKMLRRDASEATSYWLQLIVSVGIATLGLVVGSAAVVIGAMLVAPLMGPIVGLAMGLAAGSPFLVLRSAGRIALSVVFAVGGAALITILLPFHELNAEIAARTSPTVLDLITAGFCALAGVYAALRSGSDTTTTAAGTSIGISLVPPLCASGYGIGTSSWPVAGGAALLFLTNLVAIVVVGTVAFVGAGFNRVRVLTLERQELESDENGAPIARALARRLSRLFESRGGPVLRFLMPFVFLGVVYVPLRRALDEVAWQVRVRAAVQESLARESLRIVQSRVRVERHEIDVVVVVLGKTSEADAARARMSAEIRQAAGVTPRLEVLAVPDANALAGLESSLLAPRIEKQDKRDPLEQLDDMRLRVRTAVVGVWPNTASGPPLAIDLGTSNDGPLRIQVVHLGLPLSVDTLETLQRAVTNSLRRDSVILDVAAPAVPLTRENGDLPFISQVAAAVKATAGVPEISVCVTRPKSEPRTRHSAAGDADFAATLEPILATHARVRTTSGTEWSVRFVEGACSTPQTPDAGSQGDASSP